MSLILAAVLVVPWVHLLAVAVVCGAASAIVRPADPSASAALALAALALAVGVPAGRGRHGLMLVAVAALAASHAGSARDAVLAPPLGVWFAGRGGAAAAPVGVRGVLTEDAALTASGAVCVRLSVEAVDDGDGWTAAYGIVQVFVQGEAAQDVYGGWTRGRPLAATATLRWPPVLRNPGGSAPLIQRLARGEVLTGSVKSAALIDVAPGRWWHELPSAVRRYVRRTADEIFGADRRVTAAVVRAILIGDRASLDPALTDRLIAAGTYHVVAISGGNVAWLTMVVVGVCRLAVRSPRVAALVACGVVAAYGFMVGGEPSVVRAVTAACLWLGVEASGLRAPPLHIFSLVVLLVVAADPLMVVMPGSWLSFGATLGILLCAGPVAAWLAARGPGVSARGRWSGWRRLAVALGTATVAAELMLLPVGAWTFSRVGLAGLVLNFVAIPAMALVQSAGALALVLAALLPIAVGPAAALAHIATLALVESARLVEWVPQLSWRVPPPPVWTLLAYYSALGAVIGGTPPGWVRRTSLSAAGVMLLVMATGAGVERASPPRGTLRVTLLDVGQGDALVVQLPGGQVLMVDGGAAGESFDHGERVVTPALWALGVRRVDWVIFTHADLDHIGGLAAVATGFGAREIWEGVPVHTDVKRAELRAIAGRRGLVWRQLRRGDRWESGGAEVSVLHPPQPDWERPRVRNDDSVVLRIRHGPLEMLLTGDAGRDVEPLLTDQGQSDEARRAVRVLKVGHHGSRGSTSAGLVETFRPWAALVSVGRNNSFGHPAPEVLARLADARTTVLRTDRDGAVSIESDGTTVLMRTWAGRSWRVTVSPPA